MPMWLLTVPVRGARWILGLLAWEPRPRAGDDVRTRTAIDGGPPFPAAFAVDLSRLAMAAPFED